ncbi:putative mitochondrial outer membrane protein [Colletotrichum chlorophyti]|uniref:Putative mitochondrial outer membrane protein n=1 Tax=Colletotrichum chlorophyti TaxID=708187 RepID=A0A1Q8S092_9PEZI|nr:putative mitochondrial outer membrane protein [Colletotrichum chlorophyti]
MPDSIIFSVAPYHIISYGTLLGTTFFHSFVNGITMFRVLERPAFSAAQNALFPVYFTIQAALPAVLALTYPGSNSLLGVHAGGIRGLLDETNRVSALLPIATMFITGLANLLVILPKTQKVMNARYAQEKKDGKKSYDAPPHSQEMLALNKSFGTLHGVSTLVNLAGFVAMVSYGFSLAARLD